MMGRCPFDVCQNSEDCNGNGMIAVLKKIPDECEFLLEASCFRDLKALVGSMVMGKPMTLWWHALFLMMVKWYRQFGQSAPERALKISAGDEHNLAIDTSGEVVAWGTFGQCDVELGLPPCHSWMLGVPTLKRSIDMARACGPSRWFRGLGLHANARTAGSFIDVDCGDWHTVALADGTVVRGRNSDLFSDRDITAGATLHRWFDDSDNNGIPDQSEIDDGDCDANGVLDVCELHNQDGNQDGLDQPLDGTVWESTGVSRISMRMAFLSQCPHAGFILAERIGCTLCCP